MVFRTRNSSNSSRKAQFILLSAFAIVTILFTVSRWIEPYTITETSSIPIREEFFIFNNIKEKAAEVVMKSKDCEDLIFNLQEYEDYVERLSLIHI